MMIADVAEYLEGNEMRNQFGNHEDPSTDFCMEIERLEGWAADISAGVRSQWPFWARLSRLLGYVRSGAADGLDEIARKAAPIASTLERRVAGMELATRAGGAI